MLVLSLLLASSAFAAAQTARVVGHIEPCAKISARVAANETQLPATLAFKCLDSVPVDVEGNKKLIDELKLIWQFESDIAWLKNPPSTFELGPTDLIAELDKIKQNLASFSSEYVVQLAIWSITVKTGNFHMTWRPDILQVFDWTRQVQVVSLSEDGKSLPKVFLLNDAALAAFTNSSSGKISPIATINGQKVDEFLEEVAAREQWSDKDGQLNRVFSRESEAGTFFKQSEYDGGFTNITFANGTTVSYENVAATSQEWNGVIDGHTFFQTFCTGDIYGYKPNETGAEAKKALDNGLAKRSIPENYPAAIAKDGSESIAGYFLNTHGYQDTAVLKVIDFSPGNETANLEYQAAAKRFLEECVKNKKKNLIIDLRENGGGDTKLLLDLFMQLFPKDTPFSAQRNRVHELYAAIGDAVVEIRKNSTALQVLKEAVNGVQEGAKVEQLFRDWAYWQLITAEGKNFKDWRDFTGPYLNHDDLVTSVWRYNYSSSPKQQFNPFAKENIVMFTDGLCGSSCASFHEELKNIAGVKSVVVGGRPRNAPMQAVTGAKGGEVRYNVQVPMMAASLINATQNLGSTTALSTLVYEAAMVSQLLIRAGESARYQTQEQIRKGDETETPLQFIYEAADCKIFYTLKTLTNPQEAWIAAWNAFKDPKKNCVPGSTGHKSSISGGFKPYGSGPLKSTNNSSKAHGEITPTALPATGTAKPNIETAPIFNPSTHKPLNGTVPHATGSFSPVATGASGSGTPVRPNAPIYTGAASVRYRSVGGVLGAVLGALVMVL
ncbi:hypothetical protein GQ43DRAFT_499809 [Delitschia confertaspora ATCC 74209]|uniref:Tail specific protease domain-containing protein n=1 Tax=Delitschia confertaspora ATCC 74209 TaxID=1513339 RepID=A0A9P4JAU0_9PLEO|nr:hypothetical protein GQ43DRAFT_499809 [Delitschia confertaspora ATCC 74209]